ncbi:MAG: LEA type 2 family protein [Sumerlaeia bacterium]
MNLRAILFPGLMALAGLGLSGCAEMQGVLGDVVKSAPKPSASVKGAKFQDLSQQSATMLFDVEIENPYGFALPLTDVTYGLAAGGSDTSVFQGAQKLTGTVPAKGTRTVELPLTIGFQELLTAVQGVRPGQVLPYRANFDLSMTNPSGGDPIRLPIEKKGELPVPAAPEVTVEDVAWENLSLANADGVLKLKVKNTNEFAASLAQMGYDLKLSGTSVAKGSLRDAANFEAGGEQTLEIPFSVRPMDLGLAAFNMMKSGQASYDLTGDIDLGTPFAPITHEFSKSGRTGG